MSTFTTYYRMAFSFILAMLLVSGCSDQGTAMPPEVGSTDATPAVQHETAEAPSPVTTQSATEVQAAGGEKTYQTFCKVCHVNGVAGAPKFGDKEAWATRIAKGNDVLFSSVKKGLNAMPPKGTCMTCNDDDLRAAIKYLVEHGS
jgi:cytochrome c5